MPHDAVAAGLVVAGLLCGALVAVRGRAPLEGLRVLLDFLLAAGLIRLSRADSWTPLLLAALVLLVRQTAGRGLRAGERARAVGRAGPAVASGAGTSRWLSR